MKVNISSVLSAVANSVLYLATFILIFFAIAISIIRFYPNLSDIVESKIETRLADILNADIEIGSLDISRRQLFSQIVVENLRITDRENTDNVWDLRKASLSIGLINSILTRELRVKDIGLEGLDLTVRRDESGDFHINQYFLLPKIKMQSGGDNKYSAVHLSLLDSNIRWVDDLTNIDYSFEDIDISVNPTFGGYHLFISGNLPSELGQSLKSHVIINGDISNLSNSEIKFYIDTNSFRLSEIAKRFIGEDGDQVPVILDAEVWGEINNLQLSSLRGSMSAEQIVVNPSNAESELCLSDEYIQQLSMQFDWINENRNWKFSANKIQIVSSQKDWPETEVAFALKRHSLNSKSVFAHIGSMNIGAICNTLHSYSPHIVRFEDRLQHFRFNAAVEDLFVRFDLADNHQTAFQYSMKFSDAAMWQARGNKQVRGISGSVEGNAFGGNVNLASDDITIQLPDLYPDYTMRFSAEGDVKWMHNEGNHEIKSDLLKIQNDDMQLAARVNANIIGQEIYTDSQVHISTAKASAVGDYFPLVKKTQKTKKWLTEALKSGEVTDATILLRGNMRAFPFHKESGVFKVKVNVDNGILEYKKDWPQLENVRANVFIDKDRIDISSKQANMFDSKVKNVDVYIDSFLRAILQVNGTIDGPGQNLLQFLGDAGLVSKEKSIIDQIALEGDSRLDLEFSRSLSRFIDLPFKVSGKVHFLGNTLNIVKVGIDLEEVAGEIAFNADGASGDVLTASLYNQPIILSAIPLGEGATELSFQGPFDLGHYIDRKYPRFTEYFTGVAPVDGTLYLPSLFKRDNPEKLKLKIDTTLVGVSSELPAPLDKNMQQAVPATLLFDQKDKSMQWEISDLVSLDFLVSAEHPFRLRQIGLGPSQERELPVDGLSIVGQLETFPVEPWLAAYKEYVEGSDAKSSESSSIPIINIHIDELQWPQWPSQDVDLKGVLHEDNYTLELKSTLGSGVIAIPQDKDQVVTLHMQALALKKDKSKEKDEKDFIDPRMIRPFSFSSKQLMINDLTFKDVVVNSSSLDTGLSLDKIKLAADDLTVTGTGAWQVINQSNAMSSFDFQLDSSDIEDSLVDLGFNSALRKGKANANVRIKYPGAPHQIKLAEMSGQGSINMTKGSVKEIEPGGAGRLLALLNLGAISRRLSLDFKDVTNKGFTFDSIEGQLDLAVGGDLSTKSVSIISSVADIDIKGKTNIVKQTYDQHIRVIPAVVSGSLPAAGAIVGGPVGAAAGLLAERVASAVGINKVTKIEYKMTGTWEEPIIERISKKKEAAVTNTGQPSAPR